jgi:hypothetical protein
MDELGVIDPELEFQRWLEERGTILRMNKELNARAGKGSASERNGESTAAANEE